MDQSVTIIGGAGNAFFFSVSVASVTVNIKKLTAHKKIFFFHPTHAREKKMREQIQASESVGFMRYTLDKSYADKKERVNETL